MCDPELILRDYRPRHEVRRPGWLRQWAAVLAVLAVIAVFGAREWR